MDGFLEVVTVVARPYPRQMSARRQGLRQTTPRNPRPRLSRGVPGSKTCPLADVSNGGTIGPAKSRHAKLLMLRIRTEEILGSLVAAAGIIWGIAEATKDFA